MYTQQIPWIANYDEQQIPPYSLPDLLTSINNEAIRTAEQWENNRGALLEMFRKYMYGKRLPQADSVQYTLLHEKKNAVDGLAVMRQIKLEFSMKNGKSHSALMLLFLPAEAQRPVPVFTGLTFSGNHVVCDDPDIIITGKAGEGSALFDLTRGAQSRRFPLRELMTRNFALAVCSYNDFFPDIPGAWQQSILPLFLPEETLLPRPADYSAIGVWAWGISQMLDYLETLPEIDSRNAAVFGHSRLGKTALLAGAEDTRFKLVCVNDSGCGGAALNRRLYGETLFSMCSLKPDGFGSYWFAEKLAHYASEPEKLPFDQHQLIALIAPRAIAVHSAVDDQWADPKGEYLGLFHASPVYKLYGRETLDSDILPAPDTPVGSDMSYFLRTGQHDLLLEDWLCYMDAFERAVKTI